MGDRDSQHREKESRPATDRPLRDGGDVSDPGASGTGRRAEPAGRAGDDDARPPNEQAGAGEEPGKRPA